jgi:hypothetical protein
MKQRSSGTLIHAAISSPNGSTDFKVRILYIGVLTAEGQPVLDVLAAASGKEAEGDIVGPFVAAGCVEEMLRPPIIVPTESSVATATHPKKYFSRTDLLGFATWCLSAVTTSLSPPPLELAVFSHLALRDRIGGFLLDPPPRPR